MKIIAVHWLAMFAIILLGGALLDSPADFSAPAFRRAALVASLFAPAWWAKCYWAPEFYRKRMERKAKERLP